MRRLLVLALALCGLAQAQAPSSPLDLTASAAWAGWSRPDRPTEVDVRLAAGQPARVVLEVVAGRQTVATELALQPGQPARVRMPVAAAESITARARAADGREVAQTVEIRRSASPLLGKGQSRPKSVKRALSVFSKGAGGRLASAWGGCSGDGGGGSTAENSARS